MYEITFHLEDGMETVAVGSDEYVLDAAERAGLELPPPVETGMCTPPVRASYWRVNSTGARGAHP